MTYAKADPVLTPGVAGTVVVPRHVTLGTKMAVYRSYKVGLLARLRYTIDHLVPLEIAGTNDVKNLWPQPKAEAKIKDVDENLYRRQVASGLMTLVEAQQKMIRDWRYP